MGFIQQCYLDGIIEDDLPSKKNELNKTLKEVEKSLDKKFFCELENLISEFEDVLVDKWFDYGSVAREVIDYWHLGDEDDI